MKRTTIAVLVIVLACGALFAQAKDPMGKYSPTITLTTVKSQSDAVKFDDGEDWNNNIWTRGYQQFLGINGTVLWAVPQAQFQQKMNIAIAANDLPDVIPADLRQFKQLVDTGVATDMTQIFKDYIAPLPKQMFDLDEGVALGQATIKGKLMGIPQLAGNGDSPAVIWIRADWLKKLGLAAPKTMADVLAISDAFTNKDPDGNGVKDTFGMALEKGLFGNGVHDLDGFFNSYHAYGNDNDWIKDASGKLVYGSIQPQVRQALAKLAEMYQAGQIDPEFAVKDAGKVNESTTNGKTGLMFGQHWNSFWPLQDSKNKDVNADWRPYPIVSVDAQPAMPITYGSTGTIYVINRKFKNPEAAVKLINLYIDKDLALSPNFDDSYHKKDLVGGGQIPRFEYAFMQEWHPRQNLFIYQGVSDYFSKRMTDKSKMVFWVKDNVQQAETYLAGDNNGYWSTYMWSGPIGAFSVISSYWKSKLVKVSEYLGPATETMVAKNATLNKMKLETFTKIIMGAAPIGEFDTFVANWKKLGGDQITKEVNDWIAAR